MTVNLTSEQERFITERMRRSGVASPEIVVEEGLRLIQAKEEHEQRLARLRSEIDIGLAQIKRGEVVDGRQAIERILENNRQRSRS